jgi:hypothetical protein
MELGLVESLAAIQKVYPQVKGIEALWVQLDGSRFFYCFTGYANADYVGDVVIDSKGSILQAFGTLAK